MPMPSWSLPGEGQKTAPFCQGWVLPNARVIAQTSGHSTGPSLALGPELEDMGRLFWQ